jgi:hypothetical protein
MTFRMEDLLVAVLPNDVHAEKGDCTQCTRCTEKTAPPSPCASTDPETQGGCQCDVTCERATDCDDSSSAEPTKKSWRDEQFAGLSQQLTIALSR